MNTEIGTKSLRQFQGGEDLEANGTQDPTRAGNVEVCSISSKTGIRLHYAINDTPPWYLCIVLGFQHYLTMLGSSASIALMLAPALCVGSLAGESAGVATSEILCTLFFISGLSTALQCTLGTRLPIIQGGSFAFLVPALAILSLDKWKCKSLPITSDNDLVSVKSSADIHLIDMTSSHPTINVTDNSVPWQSRMRELQGAIIVASLFEVVIGLFGLVGLLMRFIGPLTIAPTIALVGISLFKAAASYSAANWWIAFLTMFLIALFSQYLRNVNVPCAAAVVTSSSFQCQRVPVRLFALFPVILAIMTAWFICFILTMSGAIPADDSHWAYKARTDRNVAVLQDAPWFRMPYPFQWGMPTFSTASIFGMVSGVLASMIESIGDYYACARLSGAQPPPLHAINRGIFVEGVGCVLSGMFGTGSGTTSYSENIGAIGITQVGSRRVVQFSAIILLLLGVFGKFGALFVAIPEPVFGGVFMVMFGIIAAVGISNLQFVNLNSTRNLFVFGFPLILGLALPDWLDKNPSAINTGVAIFDQIVTVLAKTSMFVGGGLALILDNTIPGSDEERGMIVWQRMINSESSENVADPNYNFPFCMDPILKRRQWTRYIPICPTFTGFYCRRLRRSQVEPTDLNRGPTDDIEL